MSDAGKRMKDLNETRRMGLRAKYEKGPHTGAAAEWHVAATRSRYEDGPLEHLTNEQRLIAELAGVVMSRWKGDTLLQIVESTEAEIKELRTVSRDYPLGHEVADALRHIGELETLIWMIKRYQHVLEDMAEEAEIIIARELHWRMAGNEGLKVPE